ncbi:MAG: MBL fold metallo-hydrolase [Planctomycetota bacterium]
MTRDPKARRDAAAVLLTRGHGADLEVLLVHRAPELRFFGGYLALPGGVRGPEDGPDDPADGHDVPALASCAVRELFEEVGVVLGDGLRGALAADRETVRAQLLGEGASTCWDPLRPVAARDEAVEPLCRICTPPFAPVRYDTVFFSAEMPDGERLDIRTGELVGGRFWRPDEALEAWRLGEILIVPPVVLILQHMATGDPATFRSRMRATAESYAHGGLHRVQFSPGVVMASVATPTLPPATTTNCLLLGTDRLVILDPATPRPDEQARLFALIDALRAEGAEPDSILVTHHHPDHVGAVTETSLRYRIPVHAHATTLERLAPGFLRGRALADGDVVPLGKAPDGTADWHLAALFTPGHDQGHLCFRDSRYGILIAGDMLSTVSTIVIDPPEGHLRTYLESLERLLEQPIHTLYPAHGPAVRDGQRLVRQYLRHRAQRESALRKALDEGGPARPEELVPTVYWEIDPRMRLLAARSLLAGLQKLAEDGAAAVDRDGRWRSLRANGTPQPSP